MRQRPYADTWKTEEYGRDQLNGIWRHNEVKNTGSCLRMLGLKDRCLPVLVPADRRAPGDTGPTSLPVTPQLLSQTPHSLNHVTAAAAWPLSGVVLGEGYLRQHRWYRFGQCAPPHLHLRRSVPPPMGRLRGVETWKSLADMHGILGEALRL